MTGPVVGCNYCCGGVRAELQANRLDQPRLSRHRWKRAGENRPSRGPLGTAGHGCSLTKAEQTGRSAAPGYSPFAQRGVSFAGAGRTLVATPRNAPGCPQPPLALSSEGALPAGHPREKRPTGVDRAGCWGQTAALAHPASGSHPTRASGTSAATGHPPPAPHAARPARLAGSTWDTGLS